MAAEPAFAVAALLIVTEAVALAAAHPPLATIVFVMVYVPGAVADTSIWPVLTFTNVNPPGAAVNVPAVEPPLNVGNGSVADVQYGPA